VSGRFEKCTTLHCLSLCLVVCALTGCSKKQQETAAPSGSKEATGQAVAAVNLSAPFGRTTDDLDAMLKRRNIRVIVLINPIGFFYSNGQPMGVMYETLRELEKFVNDKYKTGAFKVKVSFVPLRPDQAEAPLVQGVGDLIA
jgi:hypothetical protein